MRGMLFLFLAIAASGCLMQPYTGGQTPVGEANESPANATVAPPVQRTCLGPVCGADEQTYETDCEAYDARIAILYTGECRPPEPSCNDSDGGIIIEFAGTATKGNETHTDYCLDPAQLVEYSCLDGTIAIASFQCGTGMECKDGQCVKKNDSEENASLACAGLSEPDIYVKENVTWNRTVYSDVCVDYKGVKDYFCKDGALGSINHECPPGYGCTSGMCTQSVITCVESDQGNDTTARGKTVTTRGMSTVSEDWDVCIDLQVIREYFCLENGTSAYTEFSCGSGKKCENGRCIRSTCTEADGGVDIYIASTTKLGTANYADSCQDEHTVHEYSCYGDSVTDANIDCPIGYLCEDGACVK